MWNAICLALGCVEMFLFALIHAGIDAGRDPFLYTPMYIVKMFVDFGVCALIAYALHFMLLSSSAEKAKYFAFGFIGFVMLKAAIYALFCGWSACRHEPSPCCARGSPRHATIPRRWSLGLLATFTAVANAMLLMRAYLLHTAMVEGSYAPLADEAASPGFPPPPKSAAAAAPPAAFKPIGGVEPSASPPTVERVYSPVTYPE